jgi:hypothetical protein
MLKLYILLFGVFLSTFTWGQSQCQSNNPNTFVNEIMADMKSSPKAVNDCIVQNLKHIEKYATVKYTKKAVIIIPNDENKKVEVLKFNSVSGSKKEAWGSEKVFIKNGFFRKDNWETHSGRRKLRKDSEVMAILEGDDMLGRKINWSRKIDSAFIDESACVKKKCDPGYSYNKVSCECEANGCSEEQLKKVTIQCNEKIEANKEIDVEYRKFSYILDTAACRCNKSPIENSDGSIPGDGLKCVNDPVKLRAKRADCTAKNDTKKNKYYSFNIKKCKCESQKMLCEGKYWDPDNKINLTKNYEDDKAACLSVATNKWVDCECLDKRGDKQCRYKEIRKPVGSFRRNKMVYTDLHEHFDNETNKMRREFGPCGMDNWLANIPQPPKVKHCADREKFKIKGKDYSSGKGERFKTTRKFCIKCKVGYEEVRKIIAIDGINDDSKGEIGSFEEPAYSYVTECKKSTKKCSSKRDINRMNSCKDKRNDPKYVKRGVIWNWNPETCRCDKEREKPDKVPKTCMDKISDKKIQICTDRDGVIDPETCKCDVPCYDMVSKTYQRESGEVTCDYTPTGINQDNIEALLNSGEDVGEALCPENMTEVMRGDKVAPKIEALRDKCKQELLAMGEPVGSDSTITTTISVKVSQQVECQLNNTTDNTGFADKIPGLVGGLDLTKDFTFNHQEITDPSKIDCSNGTLRYNPTLGPKEGKYKTSGLTQYECQNVVEMYNGIKGQADKFVNSIMDIENLTVDKKLELLKNNFSANVTATANRIPHIGNESATHEELSNRRAKSMMDFYVKQVANNPKVPQAKREDLLKAIENKPQAENIAYFGPQYASKNMTLATMIKVAGPASEGCSKWLTNLSDTDLAKTKRYATGNVATAMENYYICTLDYHVETELQELEYKATKLGTKVDENFANSLRENPIFKKYLKDKKLPENYNVFGDKETYREFLVGLYDMNTEDQKAFLNSMKIFDINASSNFDIRNNYDFESEQKVTCNVPIGELYKENPVMEDYTVAYGRRPGFIERFSKKCRDDYDAMIEDEMGRLKASGDYDQLMLDLKERYPDSWEKRFNRKIRKMAKKNWRDSKYNTRSVTKGNDGDERWNKFGGKHAEGDGRKNYTETYNQDITNRVDRNKDEVYDKYDNGDYIREVKEEWNPDDYKNIERKY